MTRPISLAPGDFLFIPAGIPHAFQLVKNDTRFMGFLTPGKFEQFFRYLCRPFDGYIYPLIPPPFRFDRVIQHLAELDLKLLGPSWRTTAATTRLQPLRRDRWPPHDMKYRFFATWCTAMQEVRHDWRTSIFRKVSLVGCRSSSGFTAAAGALAIVTFHPTLPAGSQRAVLQW